MDYCLKKRIGIYNSIILEDIISLQKREDFSNIESVLFKHFQNIQYYSFRPVPNIVEEVQLQFLFLQHVLQRQHIHLL